MEKREYQKPRISCIKCYETPLLSDSGSNGPSGAKHQSNFGDAWEESSDNSDKNSETKKYKMWDD